MYIFVWNLTEYLNFGGGLITGLKNGFKRKEMIYV